MSIRSENCIRPIHIDALVLSFRRPEVRPAARQTAHSTGLASDNGSPTGLDPDSMWT